MTQFLTETSDYGAYDPMNPGVDTPRGYAEFQAANDILHLIDNADVVTRPLIAKKLARHGACMLRDVLEALHDMHVVETVVTEAGGTIRRLPSRPSLARCDAPAPSARSSSALREPVESEEFV